MRKQYIRNLVLALIQNLNPQAKKLSDDVNSTIEQALDKSKQNTYLGSTCSFTDISGIKNATFSLKIGGVFVILDDTASYDKLASSKGKLSAQKVYEKLSNEIIVNSETVSSKTRLLIMDGSDSLSPPSSSESSVVSEPSSSTVAVMSCQSSSVSQSALPFFRQGLRSQSATELEDTGASNLLEFCVQLIRDKQIAHLDPKIIFSVSIVASHKDVDLALKLCDSAEASDMNEVDKYYLWVFLQPHISKHKKIKEFCVKIKQHVLSGIEENMNDFARAYFTVKMKTDARFAAAVLIHPPLQALLNYINERVCLELVESISAEKSYGDAILRSVVSATPWETICAKQPRNFIVTLLLKLIEEHKFIPQDVLNENLLSMFLELEFAKLQELIDELNLQTAISKMIIQRILDDIVFARRLGHYECARLAVLTFQFCNANDYVLAMATKFHDPQVIAVVVSVIGHRRLLERNPTINFLNCVDKLKQWFTYEALTADVTTQRAFLSGQQLKKEHQKKEAESSYLVLTETHVRALFEKAAGTERCMIKERFVPIHEKLARLFEKVFLPHVQDHFQNLVSIHEAYFVAMVNKLSTSDPEAYNPQNYQLDCFPREMSKYFTEFDRITYQRYLDNMQEIYQERLRFEKKYQREKTNPPSKGYEQLTNHVKTILSTKIPVNQAKWVTNLQEYTQHLRDLVAKVLMSMKEQYPTVLPGSAINPDDEIFFHESLSNSLLETIFVFTVVSPTSIKLTDKNKLESKLKEIFAQPFQKAVESPLHNLHQYNK